jgi:5'-phosphate synthase pdxT subunit
MNTSGITIGVLALQGDFAAHACAIERLDVDACQVRTPVDMSGIDGLIMPGGESTTMLKLLTEEGLDYAIRDFAAQEKPIFGTCAGAILLATDVVNPEQDSLGLLDITIERNAYGRQVDSFAGLAAIGPSGEALEAIFIRAPRIRRVGPRVETVATLNGEPVFVRDGNVFASTFHPELTNDLRPHRLFLDAVLTEKRNRVGELEWSITTGKR